MTVPVDQPDWQNPQTGMSVYASILTASSIPSSGQSIVFDLSAYSSVIIWTSTVVTAGTQLQVVDADSLNVIFELTTPADSAGNLVSPTIVPIRVQKIKIVNLSTVAVTVNMRATSRITDEIKPMLGGIAADHFSGTFGASVTTEKVGYPGGAGQALFSWHWNTAAWRGYVQFLTFNGPILVADTSETHAVPQGGNAVYKLVQVPRDATLLEVVTVTAGSGNQTFDFVYEH